MRTLRTASALAPTARRAIHFRMRDPRRTLCARFNRQTSRIRNELGRPARRARTLLPRAGWEIVDVYVDGGFSGKDIDRPAFQRMLQRVRAGEINGIVVTKLDRLTRSIRNLCELNEDILRPLNVNLVCIRDGINTFEVGSSLLMHLLAVIGQIERENTSKRVAAAIAHIHERRPLRQGSLRQDHRAPSDAAQDEDPRRRSCRGPMVKADLRVVRRRQAAHRDRRPPQPKE